MTASLESACLVLFESHSPFFLEPSLGKYHEIVRSASGRWPIQLELTVK